MGIQRYVGEPLDIKVTFPSDPCVPYGMTYTDIDDISMCLKLASETDADDRYLQKTQGAGGAAVNAGTHTFTMTIESTDYANVAPGHYELVLAVEVTPGEAWIELDIPDRGVRIVPDAHRA